jgi:ANTAR domain-containing protein/GAF domain-containing protein
VIDWRLLLIAPVQTVRLDDLASVLPFHERSHAVPEHESLDAAETRLNKLLGMILDSAVEGLRFDAATITARDGGDVATVAATDQRLIALDDAQYETGQGPCLSVLDPHDPIYLPDAAEPDDRWQHFAQTAAHLGVASSLSVHLPVDSDPVAASLNLYAKQRRDPDEQSIRQALGYATQLATAIESINAHRSTAVLAHNLAEAMRSRAVIEQAKGILMADNQTSAEDAFQLMVRLSQRTNTKVRDVARKIVHTRTGSEPQDEEPGFHPPDGHEDLGK